MNFCEQSARRGSSSAFFRRGQPHQSRHAAVDRRLRCSLSPSLEFPSSSSPPPPVSGSRWESWATTGRQSRAIPECSANCWSGWGSMACRSALVTSVGWHGWHGGICQRPDGAKHAPPLSAPPRPAHRLPPRLQMEELWSLDEDSLNSLKCVCCLPCSVAAAAVATREALPPPSGRLPPLSVPLSTPFASPLAGPSTA